MYCKLPRMIIWCAKSENHREELPNVVPFAYKAPTTSSSLPHHNVPAELDVENPLLVCVLLEERQLTVESRVVVYFNILYVTSRIGAIPLGGETAVKLLGSLCRDLRLTRPRWVSTFLVCVQQTTAFATSARVIAPAVEIDRGCEHDGTKMYFASASRRPASHFHH
jgi:hypothetical protein